VILRNLVEKDAVLEPRLDGKQGQRRMTTHIADADRAHVNDGIDQDESITLTLTNTTSEDGTRMETSFEAVGHRDEIGNSSPLALMTSSPVFFGFLRDSVGSGEIKGLQERWVAPAAMYTALAGIDESAWTTSTETVLAIRLEGGVVEDHNRKVMRTSGPGRNFALQPKGSTTRFLCSTPLKFGHVFLSDSLLDRASYAEGLPNLSARLRDDLSFVPEQMLHTQLRDYLRRAFDPLIPATSLEMEGRGLLLIDALQRLHHLPRTSGAPRRGGLSPRNMRQVRDFILEHLAEDIRLDDLASLTGLNCKHFVRAFKQSTGLPPHQYLIVQRIEAAKHGLLDGGASLADIAVRCGFADQSHFTATFRKIVGVPPGAWRWDNAK
jgi:AraC family transcriptional regulator